MAQSVRHPGVIISPRDHNMEIARVQYGGLTCKSNPESFMFLPQLPVTCDDGPATFFAFFAMTTAMTNEGHSYESAIFGRGRAQAKPRTARSQVAVLYTSYQSNQNVRAFTGRAQARLPSKKFPPKKITSLIDKQHERSLYSQYNQLTS